MLPAFPLLLPALGKCFILLRTLSPQLTALLTPLLTPFGHTVVSLWKKYPGSLALAFSPVFLLSSAVVWGMVRTNLRIRDGQEEHEETVARLDHARRAMDALIPDPLQGPMQQRAAPPQKKAKGKKHS
jgi:hypothetical protein